MTNSAVTYRNSKQRNRLLEILQNTKTHPTADWLYEKLKKEYPTLSLGNLYRNLHILEEQGLIEKIHFGSTYDRYDAVTQNHYHFICENCHAIIDIEMPVDTVLNKKVEAQTGFSITTHKTRFYGLCDKCKNKQ